MSQCACAAHSLAEVYEHTGDCRRGRESGGREGGKQGAGAIQDGRNVVEGRYRLKNCRISQTTLK